MVRLQRSLWRERLVIIIIIEQVIIIIEQAQQVAITEETTPLQVEVRRSRLQRDQRRRRHAAVQGAPSLFDSDHRESFRSRKGGAENNCAKGP